MIKCIYLSEEQQNVVNVITKLLEKKIESKINKKVLYKYDPSNFIKQKIEITFVNGLPTSASYDNYNLGSCTNKKNKESDVVYKIGKIMKFDMYRKKTGNFILNVSFVNSGICGYASSVFDKDTNKYIDFSDYESW